MTETISKGQKTATDIASLLRARTPLLWVVTREETRVETFLYKAATAAGYKTLFWDVAQGVTELKGKRWGSDDLNDSGAALKMVREEAEKGDRGERRVWIFRDLNRWVDEGMTGATITRQLRNLAKALPGLPRKSAQAIIVLTTSAKVPADLEGHATVIDFPLPDRSEIAVAFDAAINNLPEFEIDPETGEEDKTKPLRAKASTPETRERAIDAAVGLTNDEAASCFAKSLVQTKTIDPAIVAQEKKRVIAKAGVLEWIEPVAGGLDAIGGLDEFKDWLLGCKAAYSPEAREYGLPLPKGPVLVGVPGCGKSLSAKCAPTALEVPCLRLDLGALKGKFVGESEGNIRKAFGVIEAIGRCILWIDEIEKAISSNNAAAADGGVSSDQLGFVLNWLQESKSGAFVIATANDVSNLPPELLRKGRFGEVFYVGLPNHDEAKSVLTASLKQYGRAKVKINLGKVIDACEAVGRFTGSEIAELVPTALRKGFADGRREITTDDLIEAAGNVVPLSRTKAKKIAEIEAWGAENAKPATRAVRAKVSGIEGRDLDL